MTTYYIDTLTYTINIVAIRESGMVFLTAPLDGSTARSRRDPVPRPSAYAQLSFCPLQSNNKCKKK